jgi:signal transduction histidine kinase/HAMP domain-containing protein
MSRPFIGVRWWLGAAFAVVAATSTAIVVSQFSSRSENEFRGRAEQLAAGNAVLAATQLKTAIAKGALRTSIADIARRQSLDLLLYDRTGALVARAAARRRPTPLPREAGAALREALAGQRPVTSTADGQVVVVGLPLQTSETKALVALSYRPDVAAAIGIVSDQALRAGVIAGVIGVLVGLLLAQLIALRLRRLTAAAEALALGDFESPLRYRFRDEFGALAQSFDRMRRQLRRSFRRLEVERDRLRMLLERLHEGVLTIDQDLVVHFANAEARRLLGGRLAEGDALPEPWHGFALREFAQSLFEERPAPLQVHVSPDEEHAYGLVGIPAQPETEWALLVIDDLTEQERRELAEREFVSNAAHELRTPLTTIIGAVEVLQAGAKDDPAQRDRFLGHIEREARRLARLARAMLTLARAHSGQEQPRAEPVELAPLLGDIAGELRPRDGVAVEVECAAGLAARVNRDLLEQVLRNLAENAAKHTSRGHVVLRGLAEGATVALEVEDTGPGMSAEIQQHVFDRFYRGERDADGFGLGLAIVRESVRTLGGRVELDSSPGEGTLFRIVLEGARVRDEVTA